METGLQKTLKLLKKHEGFRDTVYLDGNGIPTIGYGFTDPELVKKGKITLKEADDRLTKEIANRYNTLKDTLPNFEKLSDDSKAALISYHFNYPAGFKDTTRFMKYWTAGDYQKAIKEVDAGMNDPKNPGLRPRRLEELAMLSSDPFLSGITSVKTKDGNKILKFPVPENKEYKSTWEPYRPAKTIYPLNNTTPKSISSWSGADAPNATPRVKDFDEALNEALKPIWDTFERAAKIGHQSPFSLNLSLPSLDSLLLINSPLRLIEQYFADALGISDMLPLMPSLFPRLKDGKLPKYADGDTPEYADATWHENWLNGRKKQFEENVLSGNGDYGNAGTILGQINNIKNSRENYNIPQRAGVGGRTMQTGSIIGYNVIEYPTSKEDTSETTKIHERTHAANNWNNKETPQEQKVRSIQTRYGIDDGYQNTYDYSPAEQYARINEARKRLGLAPDYIVTKEDVNRWHLNDMLDPRLVNVGYDALVKMFNEVAYAPLLNSNNTGIIYAKDGKSPIHIKPVKQILPKL